MAAMDVRKPEEIEYDSVTRLAKYFPDHHMEKIRQDFKFRQDDVVVTTFPKSGTTWMIEIVWLLMNDVNVEEAKTSTQSDRVPFLEFVNPTPGSRTYLDLLEESPSPRIIKTHLPYSDIKKELIDKQPRVVFGVRNVKDTLVSYYHFHKMHSGMGNVMRPFGDFLEAYKEGKISNVTWHDFVLDYWNDREQLNMFLLKYEDLHKDFRGTVMALAEFLGRKPTDDQLKSLEEHVRFDNMKNNKQVNNASNPRMNLKISPFIRKGGIGDWKNYFAKEESDGIDQMTIDKMADSGLYFDYE